MPTPVTSSCPRRATLIARTSSPTCRPVMVPIYVVEQVDTPSAFLVIFPNRTPTTSRRGRRRSCRSRGFGGRWISASVTRTAWSLNVKSRTLRAEIDLPNTDSRIRCRLRQGHRASRHLTLPPPSLTMARIPSTGGPRRMGEDKERDADGGPDGRHRWHMD